MALILIPLTASAAGPIHKWSKQYGGTGDQSLSEVALDPAGNVVVTGGFSGSIDFGGGPLTAVGTDAFLAKLTPAGGHIWSKRFGDSGSPQGVAVAVSSSGKILMVGSFSGTVDFGGGPLVGAADGDVFAAEFDSNGNHLWSAAFGDATGSQGGASAAFDSNDNMLIAGWAYGGSINLGGGSFTANGMDGWVAKYDANGAYLWSHRIGDVSADPNDGQYQFITNVRVDPSDDVVISGAYWGTVDFGNGPETSVSQDMFLTRFHSDGSFVRNQTFTSGQYGLVNANGMAIDGAGNVVVGGLYENSVDFGGGPLPPNAVTTFLVSFDATGAHNWSHGFERRPDGDPSIFYGDANGIAVGVNAAGQIAFTGDFQDSLSFGGDWLVTGQNSNSNKTFVAKFDANGSHIWSGAYGPWASGTSATVGSDGDVYAVGTIYSGSVDFGGGTFTATKPNDAYLVRFGAGPVLPVLIQRFDASPDGAGVSLRWNLWSDEEIDRFTIQRRDGSSAPVTIAEIADAHARSFVDRSVEPGRTYRYELAVNTKDGDTFRSPMAAVTTAMARFALGENHPNPLNPETTIPYQLPGTAKMQHVEMRVVDATGRVVRTLLNEDQPAGSHSVDWNGRDDRGNPVASGVYFCVLKAGKEQLSRKMVVLK
jgi:hypothetical protein